LIPPAKKQVYDITQGVEGAEALTVLMPPSITGTPPYLGGSFRGLLGFLGHDFLLILCVLSQSIYCCGRTALCFKSMKRVLDKTEKIVLPAGQHMLHSQMRTHPVATIRWASQPLNDRQLYCDEYETHMQVFNIIVAHCVPRMKPCASSVAWPSGHSLGWPWPPTLS